MSSLIFRRSGWALQISRSSRQFSISFAARIPGDQKRRISSLPAYSGSRLQSPPQSPRAWSHAFSTATPFRQEARNSPSEAETSDLTSGFNDEPLILDEGSRQVDWSRSFHGLSTEAFPTKVSDILLAPVDQEEIEVKPDGLLYLPEIKYRRILNKAFGPGAWGLAPRGETIVTPKAVTREYALVAQGRLISVARGEQDYFSPEGIPTATEGCKSNALVRCCKDLGVASELWDPRFIRKFTSQRVREVWVENQSTKKKRKISVLKDQPVQYPWKIVSSNSN